MKKKSQKLDINNLVAVDGFHFLVDPGLLIDVFEESGYVVPKNIRADEFFNSNNFSWPRALNNEYTLVLRDFASLATY